MPNEPLYTRFSCEEKADCFQTPFLSNQISKSGLVLWEFFSIFERWLSRYSVLYASVIVRFFISFEVFPPHLFNSCFISRANLTANTLFISDLRLLLYPLARTWFSWFLTSIAANSCYCSVLFKWNFFIQMRASCLPLSFHQKRGATERGWVQNRPFSFEHSFE